METTSFLGASCNVTPRDEQAFPGIIFASRGVLSVDLSSYATRQYVDNATPSLSGYATQDWVTQQISAAMADLVNLEEEEF